MDNANATVEVTTSSADSATNNENTGTLNAGIDKEAAQSVAKEQEVNVGSSLMSGLSEKEESDNAEDGKSKEAQEQAQVTGDKKSPVEYELQFSEGTNVDETLLSSFKNIAKENGLSQEQAQGLAGMYEKFVKEQTEKSSKEHIDYMLSSRKQWEEEIKARPGYSIETQNIQTALRHFGDPELYGLLNETNLGSHPKFWDFMARISKELAEPGEFSTRNTPRGEIPLAERLWPDMNKRLNIQE